MKETIVQYAERKQKEAMQELADLLNKEREDRVNNALRVLLELEEEDRNK